MPISILSTPYWGMIRSTRQLLCAMWMTFAKIKVAEIQGSGCIKEQQLASRFLHGDPIRLGRLQSPRDNIAIMYSTLKPYSNDDSSCSNFIPTSINHHHGRAELSQARISRTRLTARLIAYRNYTECPTHLFFVLSLRSSLVRHATARLASLASGYILPIMTWEV